jgi:hypothetical protein
MIPWMLCSLHSLCSLLHPFGPRVLLMILFEQDAGNGAAP